MLDVKTGKATKQTWLDQFNWPLSIREQVLNPSFLHESDTESRKFDLFRNYRSNTRAQPSNTRLANKWQMSSRRVTDDYRTVRGNYRRVTNEYRQVNFIKTTQPNPHPNTKNQIIYWIQIFYSVIFTFVLLFYSSMGYLQLAWHSQLSLNRLSLIFHLGEDFKACLHSVTNANYTHNADVRREATSVNQFNCLLYNNSHYIFFYKQLIQKTPQKCLKRREFKSQVKTSQVLTTAKRFQCSHNTSGKKSTNVAQWNM